MKIFAKRKRKAEQPTVEKTFQSDAVVEALLNQDPSSWNAKQRRLVKRYQDRNEHETSTDGALTEGATKGPVPAEELDLKDGNEVELKESVEQSGSISDDGPDSSGSDDDESEGDARVPATLNPSQDKPTTSDAMNEVGKTESNEEVDLKNPTVDNELKEVLDKLNSKQRRKLMRLLERDGDVEAVRVEAVTLLEGDKKPEKTDTSDQPPPKKTRRKGGTADLCALTPDERMRRDEQRRLQQEAAKAREAGALSNQQHKHPLNSERRRANRRKPKWEPKSQPVPNEHHSSGYHMRKITGGKAS